MSEVRARTDRWSLKPTFHLVLENSEKKALLDETDAVLLRRISESDSLTDAAKRVGISYRNAWDRLNKLETTLEAKVVETKVGGTRGGETRLTEDGVRLLNEFRRLRKYLFNALEDDDILGQRGHRLGSRNRLRAKIVHVRRGSMTSEVEMLILHMGTLTSVISNEVMDHLSLEEDDEVEAVVKTTGVIIAKKKEE